MAILLPESTADNNNDYFQQQDSGGFLLGIFLTNEEKEEFRRRFPSNEYSVKFKGNKHFGWKITAHQLNKQQVAEVHSWLLNLEP